MKHERFESFLQLADAIRLVFLQKSFYAFRARYVMGDSRDDDDPTAEAFKLDESGLFDEGFG